MFCCEWIQERRQCSQTDVSQYNRENPAGPQLKQGAIQEVLPITRNNAGTEVSASKVPGVGFPCVTSSSFQASSSLCSTCPAWLFTLWFPASHFSVLEHAAEVLEEENN